jgi:hypothetical protein
MVGKTVGWNCYSTKTAISTACFNTSGGPGETRTHDLCLRRVPVGADEPLSPALWSAAHRWRTAQARLRDRAIDRRQLRNQKWTRAVASWKTFFFVTTRQTSRPWTCSSCRPLASSYVIVVMRLGPVIAGVDQRHHKLDRGMDRPAARKRGERSP